jgi:hypothetical protein
MYAFLVVDDGPPLSSCPPKTETDSLQKIEHEMIWAFEVQCIGFQHSFGCKISDKQQE